MVLARPEGAPEGMKGVTLFLLPKVREDGTRNAYRIVRLKDKLGSRSMASGEVRLEGASAYLIGEIGRGFQQMADMVNMSRLSNGVRAAGLMRRALSEALFVARHRRAFGKHLIDMPLMQKQLLKMMLPTEQARSMFMQIATLLPRADGGEVEAQKCVRILTPLIKFRACRDARRVTGDAMEVRGGVGYIEEWSDPRLVRDAHLGSIWEGTSNIVALDVARAVSREQALEPLQRHLRRLLDDSDLPGTPATSSTNCWCEWSRPWPTSPNAARTSRCARPAAPSITCARRSSWPGRPAARHPTSAAWPWPSWSPGTSCCRATRCAWRAGPTRPNCWPGWSARCR